MSSTKETIVFICQPGELEIKALLLAYTLNVRTTWKKEVYIPKHLFYLISDNSLILFKKWNTSVRTFENPFIEQNSGIQKGDWMSNKFFALKALEPQQDIVFLDSDIICLKDFSFFNSRSGLAAKPADFSVKVNWNQLAYELEVSFTDRKTITTVDKMESPPYFNSGVLFIKEEVKGSLLEYWEKYFLVLSDSLKFKRASFDNFHRDQIALTFAIEDLNLSYQELSENYNYPARRRHTLSDQTVFAHYHDCSTIEKHEELLDTFKQFSESFPEVKNVLKQHIEWQLLSQNKHRRLWTYRKIKHIKKRIFQKFIR